MVTIMKSCNALTSPSCRVRITKIMHEKGGDDPEKNDQLLRWILPKSSG